ncbi:ATP-binding protein [Streptomyces sp. NPDC050546]|uniref:ATP-binding protein n=1 Tax=Streptomyces sp. NPDC050546 TaxID=3365628 RepID=UPI00378CD8B0
MATAEPRPTGHPGYNVSLICEGRAAGQARRLVHIACSAWQIDDETAHTGALVMTEFIANAIRHTRSSSIRVRVERPRPDRLRVAVVDKSRRMPDVKPPNSEATGGRGLLLVRALTASWGTDPLPWGKQVWAEIQVKGCGQDPPVLWNT